MPSNPASSKTSLSRFIRALLPSLVVFGLVLTACLIVLAQPAETQQALLEEYGPFENMTLWLYVAAFAALALLYPTPRMFFTHIYFPYLALALMFREMDFDKTPFTHGMLHILQYTGDDVPTLERIITITLVLILLAMFCTMVWRHGLQFWQALWRFDVAAWTFVGMLGFGATAKSLDGLSRKLRDFGVQISENTKQIALTYEEIAELAIAAMLLLTILFVFKRHSQTQESVS